VAVELAVDPTSNSRLCMSACYDAGGAGRATISVNNEAPYGWQGIGDYALATYDDSSWSGALWQVGIGGQLMEAVEPVEEPAPSCAVGSTCDLLTDTSCHNAPMRWSRYDQACNCVPAECL
jgi:hypothetical protein